MPVLIETKITFLQKPQTILSNSYYIKREQNKIGLFTFMLRKARLHILFFSRKKK